VKVQGDPGEVVEHGDGRSGARDPAEGEGVAENSIAAAVPALGHDGKQRLRTCLRRGQDARTRSEDDA